MINPLVPLPLFADAGVPMIFLTLPMMVILLVPIIVVEGFLCKKWLGLTTWQAMKSNAVSNVASTVIGIPIVWALLLGLEYGTFEIMDKAGFIQRWHSPMAKIILFFFTSAWVPLSDHQAIWWVPAAILALLVPFFFASYGVEYLVMRFMVGKREGAPPNLAYPRVRIAVRNANLITYGVMFVVTSVWLVLSLPQHLRLPK